MEEEITPQGDQKQAPSVWDKVDAMTPRKAGSVWDRVDSHDDDPRKQAIDFNLQEGAKRDPERAARVIRLANRFKMPEPFAEQNLERLEEEERKGALASEDLANQNPVLADAIAHSPNYSAAALKHLPALKQLEMLYTRPPALWPMSEGAMQGKARGAAKLMAERAWQEQGAAPRVRSAFSEDTGPDPAYASSQQEMEEMIYQRELADLKHEEGVISKTGKVDFLEALGNRFSQNPMAAVPAAGRIPDIFRKAGVSMSRAAEKAGTADDLDRYVLERASRLESAANFRGRSFGGYIGEGAAALPGTLGEFMMGGTIGRGAKELVGITGTSMGSKLAGMLTESLAGAGSSGLAEGAEAFVQHKGEGASDAASAAMAARDTFASYFSAQLFGPWFAKAAPEIQTAVKESLLKAMPKEALKLVGMTAAGDVIKAIGPDAMEHLKNATFVRALSGDPEAWKELGATGTIGAAMGGVTAVGRNLKIEGAQRSAQLYAEAALRRGDLLHSELSKENPDLARYLSEKLSQGGPQEHTLIPVKSFIEHYGEQAREKAAEMLGGPEAFDRAKANGVDLVIPTAAYDHAIGADPTAAKFFSNEIRPGPGVANLREAGELEKAYNSGMRIPARERIVQQIMEEAKGDRTKEAIGRARLEQGGDPLLADPQTLGLSPDQTVKLQEAMGRAQAEAESHVNAKEMERRDSLKSQLYERELKRITEEVTREVDSRRDQVALARLKRRELPGGQPLPPDAPEIKLDRKAVADAYGKEALALLPRGIFTKEGGLHPEDVAGMLGYGSGADLLADLAKLHTLPANAKEAAARKKLAVLEEARKSLDAAAEAASAEGKALKGDVLAGREQIARQLEKSMRDEARQQNESAAKTLKEIRERGGIRPSDPTDRIPKELRAKGKEGVSSDELAQDLYDQGHPLSEPESGALYDYVEKLKAQLAKAKDEAKDFEGTARKLSRAQVEDSLKGILENAKGQEELRGVLEQFSAQAAEERRGIATDRRAATIEAEAAKRMAEKFPAGLQPSELSEAATEALHNKHSAALDRLALEYLVENKLTEYKEGIRTATRKLPSDAEVTRQAESDVLGRKLSTLDPKLYLDAEARAKKEALEAALKGKWDEVFDARLRALHAHESYRAAKDAVTTTKKALEKWADLPTAEFLNKATTADWGQQVKNLLRKIGLAAVDPRDLEGMKPFNDWAREKYDAGQTRMESLHIEPRFASEEFQAHYRDMTYGDVLSLKDTIDQLTHLAREVDKIHVAAKKVGLDGWVKSFTESVSGAFKKRATDTLTDSPKSPWEKILSFGRRVDASLDRPEPFFDRLDGGKLEGPANEGLWQPQVEARTKFAELRRQFSESLRKAVAEIPKEIVKRLDEKIRVDGLKIPVTRREAMAIVANGGNESSYSKMTRGEQIRNVGLTPEKIQEIAKQLTPPELDFVQKLLDITNSFWPEIEKLHVWATGKKPPKIEAKQMIEAMGDRPGGYYPAMYDSRFSKAGEIQVSGEIGKLLDPSYRSATTDAGYRQARVEEFAAPMDFNFGRLATHVDSMAKDIAFRPWLMDANKMVSSPEVLDVVRDHLGPEYRDYMRGWVKRVVGAESHPSDPSISTWNKMIGTMRHNVTMASLMLKPSVFLHNALGVGPVLKQIGPKYFAEGYKEFLSAPKDSYQRMVAESKDMAGYLDTFDANVRESLHRLEGKTGAMADVQRLGMKVIPLGNLMLAVPTYYGAKAKATAEFAAKGVTGAALESLAIKAGEKAVRLTGGSGNPGDVPAVMRSEGMKMLLMFYTPGSIMYSQMKDAVHDFSRGGDLTKFLVKSFWILPTAAVLDSILSGRLPDEDRDETYAGMVAKDMVTQPFSALPMGAEIARNVADAVTGNSGHSGFGSPAFRAMDTTFNALKKTSNWWNDEAEFEDVARAVAKTAGFWFGAPTEQLEITGGYMTDLMRGKADQPNDLFEFFHDMLWRRPASRR